MNPLFPLAAFIFLSCVSCKPTQSICYSIFTRFGRDTSSITVLDYRDDLFQYRIRKNLHREIITPDSVVSTISYDTLGIEIINVTNKSLVAINKFSEDFQVLNFGKYPDDSKVLKTGEMAFPDSLINKTSLKDSTIGGEYYFIFPFEIKDSFGQDSVTGSTFWTNGKRLKSVFFLQPDKNPGHLPLGVYLHLHKDNCQVELRIRGIRPLSYSERLMCEKIIKKLTTTTNP